jgi:hypothetical protein
MSETPEADMELAEVKTKFGLNPEETGNRPRGFWVLEAPDEDWPDIPVGSLVVKSRDGASNPISVEAMQHSNCIGSVEDDFDCTYRYYFYKPL